MGSEYVPEPGTTSAPPTEISRLVSTRFEGRGNVPLLFILKTGIQYCIH